MKTSKMFQNDPGRNAILRGICPQVFGLFTVKLAGKHIHPWLAIYKFTVKFIAFQYRLDACYFKAFVSGLLFLSRI